MPVKEFKPHPYQKYAIERIVEEPHVGLFLDMGLGKTAITLSAINELIRNRFEVSKVLIIAPKKVSEATWQNEAKKWADFSPLRFSTVLGSKKQRILALKANADVYVINRENVQWLITEYFEAETWDFDMIVFDESSSFKNGTSKRFKAIRKVLSKTPRTVILTGTPAPNGIEDLWAQIYLLDRGERLGKYVTHFKERFFDYNAWTYELRPKPGAFESIQRKISDICVSMSAKDYLQLEDMVIDDVKIALDDKTRKDYTLMEREMVLSVEDGDDISIMSAAALTNKLLQLCSGTVYDSEHETHAIHDSKSEMLSELLEQMHGESALVFYGFRHEPERIKKAAIKAGIKPEHIRELNGAEDVEAWNCGKVKVLIAHPASCGYGLNLQSGGHHIVWFTLTWNLELYQQSNARLHRQGQTLPTIVHRLLVENSVDEDVVNALDLKDESQTELINALKYRIKNCR